VLLGASGLIRMAVTSDLVVAIVLGPQWEAVVTPLQILCIYGALYSSQALFGHVLLWTGRFRANMWCNVLAAIVLPAAFYVGARWGLVGIAWAWVVAFPLVTLPNLVVTFRAVAINVWPWIGACAPSLLACMIMVVAVLLVRAMLPASASPPICLAASIATGVFVYSLMLASLFRGRLKQMAGFLRSIRAQS